jgi:VWFA-related protein
VLSALRWLVIAALAQVAEFHVPVREVNTPVSVFTSDGKLLDGLTTADFHVFDNGRPQRAHVDTEFEPISLAVAVECDRAVRRSLPEIRKIPSIIEILMLGVASDAAVLSFGREVKLMQPFTHSAERIDKAIRSLAISGDSGDSVAAALEAIDLLAHQPPKRRRLLLLIAVAGERAPAARIRDVLAAAEAGEVRVYALTIPHSRVFSDEESNGSAATLDLTNLVPAIFRGSKKLKAENAIAIVTQYTGGRAVEFRNQRALESAMTAMGAEFHSEYHLRYTPDSSEAGWHRLRVEVDRKGALVRARSGYFRN